MPRQKIKCLISASTLRQDIASLSSTAGKSIKQDM